MHDAADFVHQIRGLQAKICMLQARRSSGYPFRARKALKVFMHTEKHKEISYFAFHGSRNARMVGPAV